MTRRLLAAFPDANCFTAAKLLEPAELFATCIAAAADLFEWVDSSPTFRFELNKCPAILSGASLTTSLVSGKAVVAPVATASSV
jgi:hypothetical protein